MRIFDSHCHVDDSSFDKDLDEVLKRADQAGVLALMLAGITEKSCEKALEIAKTRPGCFVSVGVHPHDCKACTEKSLERLEVLAKNPLVRAWGETGLDFARMFSPKPVQETWFAAQLDAARKLDLPVIIHERDSGGRVLEILGAHPPGLKTGVVHCFSGTREELSAYLDMGFYIGITGICTQKERGAGLRDLIPLIPEDRMVIETDSPYLVPWPRSKETRRNEPAFLVSILARLAEIRNRKAEGLARVLWENTCRLYDIEGSDGWMRQDKMKNKK
jgi:TatD DNase family protein